MSTTTWFVSLENLFFQKNINFKKIFSKKMFSKKMFSKTILFKKYIFPKYIFPNNSLKKKFFSGPFLPCEDLFDWWTLRCGVWVVFLFALLGNGTVVFVLIFSRSKMDVPRFLVCNLAAADFFMGIYLGKTIIFAKQYFIATFAGREMR